MTAIKESSTIQENKKTVFQECPVTYVMEKIGGYWKPIILFQLLSGKKRYHELKKNIPGISEKVLIQQLKQLETDELIVRDATQNIPPVVHYSLTPSGIALRPVLYAMAVWAIEETDMPVSKKLEDFPGRDIEI
ncbi:helix-turn-helix domain-containing protein [Chitinophaga sancti]|uniref:winged helix-turn-helix transcriptional regulator n=1 Tax=Chitinophaga sancti TaxID=1004 RepID=UPI002A761110|nr:helix-turn-helix domain-containing protein [Chitinophaga sancti]WPQ62733.1 helix-turn-helix domain-containing protein [Chitinophaga sancti]